MKNRIKVGRGRVVRYRGQRFSVDALVWRRGVRTAVLTGEAEDVSLEVPVKKLVVVR